MTEFRSSSARPPRPCRVPRKRRPRASLVLAGGLLFAGLFPVPATAAGKGEAGPVFPVEILLQDRAADLKLLTDLDIDVDGVFFDRARAYVIEEEMEKLTALGLLVGRIPDEGKIGAEMERLRAEREGPAGPGKRTGSIPTAYHTYATLTAELQAIAAARGDLTRLVSAGKSVQNRELWVMKITDNPAVEEDEPEVHYIGGIHGDEVVGKELLIELIHHLLDNYGTDPRVTALVDATEIWLMPSMNPDGTELSQRYNANGTDLNRNFPDQFTDPNNTTTGRQAETAAVMNWRSAHTSLLSGIMHGGALVANYPYDGNAAGVNEYSASPEDGLCVSLSRSYADHSPSMLASNSDASFFNGICNGADWYVVRGGVQDWGFVWKGSHDLTLELGTKWPAASTLPSYWSDNVDAMLSYFERVHAGVRGIVTDATTGAPLAATIKVVGSSWLTYADPDVGDYHRMLLPGTYTLEISAPGHVTAIVPEVVVPPGQSAVRRDVALLPTAINLQPAGYWILDGTSGNAALDPGETADLALTLRNLGGWAATPTARIEPTGWYGSAPRSQATYANIPSNTTKTSNSPHFSVTMPADIPAGHKMGFAVRWTSGAYSGVSDPFFIPVGLAACQTFTSTNVPRSVTDRATATSAVAVGPDIEIERINVTLNVSHPYKGDLAISVVSPAGTPILLHNHTGGSDDNVVGTFDSTLGSFEPMNRVAGESSAGTWTLKVTDTVPANTGTLNSWSLQVCGRPFEAAPPEMKLRSVTKGAGRVILDWWRYAGLTSYRVYRSADPTAAGSYANVTGTDTNQADTHFEDASAGSIAFYIVTGVGPRGEGAWGHYGQ